MQRILITGATGNVGMEVLKSIEKIGDTFQIYAGVFNLEKGKEVLKDYKLKTIHFDFTNNSTYKPALSQCDILFLLRPPQLSAVNKYFKPLLKLAAESNVKHIVFLSVQGVEKSSIIPHHKIEKLIVASGIPYTFLRPAYFMQNFTTTLHTDLATHHRIFLPAGNAKFTLIDVSDIGKVAAIVLTQTDKHINTSYELTNNEKLTFTEMATKLSQGLETTINYQSPSLLRFFMEKRKEKMPTMLIFVMMMLHYFPRFENVPSTTTWVKNITNQEPKAFDQFVAENKKLLIGK